MKYSLDEKQLLLYLYNKTRYGRILYYDDAHISKIAPMIKTVK